LKKKASSGSSREADLLKKIQKLEKIRSLEAEKPNKVCLKLLRAVCIDKFSDYYKDDFKKSIKLIGALLRENRTKRNYCVEADC
jgi:hypothetical protein